MATPYDKVGIFKESISTLKDTSLDGDKKDKKYMTESTIKVVNFDTVKKKYVREKHLPHMPCSSDALCVTDNGNWNFVEFKNGSLDQSKIYEIYYKIYDSLLIFGELMDQSVGFCRDHVNFVLVYNESKNSEDGEKGEQVTPSRVTIGDYFSRKAGKKFIRFGLERFEHLYFREVFTYTEKQFEQEFLQKIAQ